MLNLYIVRHGQTEWNLERRFQGWLDSPLTEHGVESAKQLKQHLKPHRFHHCVSSPSPRASRTMELILSEHHGGYKTDERLREINLGPWQGMKHEEIEVQFPEQLEIFYNHPENFWLSDAETYHDVYERVNGFLNEQVTTAKKKSEPHNVLVVTHGVTLMMFQLIMDGKPLKELSEYTVAPNTQVHHYAYHEDRFSKKVVD